MRRASCKKRVGEREKTAGLQQTIARQRQAASQLMHQPFIFAAGRSGDGGGGDAAAAAAASESMPKQSIHTVCVCRTLLLLSFALLFSPALCRLPPALLQLTRRHEQTHGGGNPSACSRRATSERMAAGAAAAAAVAPAVVVQEVTACGIYIYMRNIHSPSVCVL